MKTTLLLVLNKTAILSILIILAFSLNTRAQNIFPSSGNVGIGTNSPQTDLHLRRTVGDTELIIEADADNNNENDNPFISLKQDNGGGAFIGLVGDNNTSPQMPKYPRWAQDAAGNWSSHTDAPGTLANSLILATGDQKSIQLATMGLPRMTVRWEGNVGIGTNLKTNEKNYLLAVKGKIGAHEIEVENTSNAWADYVFEDDYLLTPLNEVESFVKSNKHLPEIPSKSEIEQNGHNLGDMDVLLLKKVEELTLYMIELNKENIQLRELVEAMKTDLDKCMSDHQHTNAVQN